MFEEEKNEERKRYIEELVARYTRRVLNEIASGLGLEPDNYPNKRAIAEAILEAREREEAMIEEAIPEYPAVEEVRKEVEKVSPDTVRGKIKAIMDKAVEFNAAAQAFQQSVQEQMKENEAALAALNSGVQEQMKENEDAVKKIYAFAPVFQQSVQKQVKENENFVKQFYG